jgi:hypothetical protein
MEEYFGTVFGKLRIPLYVFIESPEHRGFQLKDVEVEWNPTPFIPPEEILRHKEQLVKEKEAAAKARGAPFYDGPMVRLKDYGFSDENEEKCKVILKEQLTSYFTYQATNASLDKKICDGGTKTIREKYIKNPYSFDDVLANPIGVSVLVISEEGKMVYVQRSNKVNIFPNLYHDLAAGYMNPQKDLIDGKPHPFKTAQRETEEEAGIKFDVNEFKLLCVGRDSSTDLHPEIFGELRTPMTVEEILSTPKRAKFEQLKILNIPFTPEDVIPLLRPYIKRENNYEAVGWVPAGAVNVLYSLIGEYGYERVKKVVDEL